MFQSIYHNKEKIVLQNQFVLFIHFIFFLWFQHNYISSFSFFPPIPPLYTFPLSFIFMAIESTVITYINVYLYPYIFLNITLSIHVICMFVFYPLISDNQLVFSSLIKTTSLAFCFPQLSIAPYSNEVLWVFRCPPQHAQWCHPCSAHF